MEATSSTGAGGRRRATVSSQGLEKRNAGGGLAPIHRLSPDLLRSIFVLMDPLDLVCCSAVCKSWQKIIDISFLLQDIYRFQNPLIKDIDASSMKKMVKIYVEDLAMEQHTSALLSGSADVHMWKGHSTRVNLCRIRRGVIATGVGDKVLRLWSAESYKCMDEYPIPGMKQLVDYDFDESKIVGATDSGICIWRRNAQRSVFQSHDGTFRALCMSYVDTEAVVGCEDGRARIFDIYSGSCTQIFKIHSGPVTCLTLADERLFLSGSDFGSITITDLSSGEKLSLLTSSISPTGMKSLFFNTCTSKIFAGSTSGYVHCWDIRTLRPLWEKRASPNVIYTVHHLVCDGSTLALGGLDGVLRIVNQSTGELLSSLVIDGRSTGSNSVKQTGEIELKKARSLTKDAPLHSISRHVRPPITCLAVGMKKIVTTQ